MEDSDFVKDVKGFAKSASVDTEDFEFVFCLRIVASFAQISCVDVMRDVLWNLELRDGPPHARMRPCADEIDWATVSSLLKGDTSNAQTVARFWLKMLSFVDFIDEPALSADMEQYLLKVRNRMHGSALPSYSPIDAVRVAVCKSCPALTVTWADVCKTFLIVNVIQEDPAAAVMGLFRDSGHGVPDDMGVQVARHLVGFRNSPIEHQETLVTLLTSYMTVDTKGITSLFDIVQKSREKSAIGVKTVFLQRLRPSLSEMVRVGGGGGGTSQGGGGEREEFSVFSRVCRFPLNMSPTMQRYVYLLKSMHDGSHELGVDVWPFITAVVQCPVLLRNVEQTSVVRVDAPALLAVIAVAHNVGEPSKHVKMFRSECIDPFMNGQSARMHMNWSVVLQLYLGAFQRASVRHDVWRQVVQASGDMGFDQACTGETLQAVDGFVMGGGFDAQYALGMLERSVRSVDSTGRGACRN